MITNNNNTHVLVKLIAIGNRINLFYRKSNDLKIKANRHCHRERQIISEFHYGKVHTMQ